MLESVIHRRDRGAELRIPKSRQQIFPRLLYPVCKGTSEERLGQLHESDPRLRVNGGSYRTGKFKIKSTLGVSKEGVKVDVDLETNWFGTTGVPIGSPHRGSLSKVLHRPDIPIEFLTENRQLSAIGRRDAPSAGC